MATYELFIHNVEEYTFNQTNRELGVANKQFAQANEGAAKEHFNNLDLVKSRANVYRRKAMDNLDKLLVDFETDFAKRGGKTIWINNEKEAHYELVKIVQKSGNNYVFIGDSDIANELKLEVGLNKEKITIFGQEPYKVAIAEANFLCTEGGIIAIANNDYKLSKIVQQAEVQIFIIGIESITQSLIELDLMLQLQALYKTGLDTFEITNFIAGNDTKNNSQVYLFLVDNGRSNLLYDNIQKQALNCIKCQACINVCNVANNVGVRNYDAVYAGPIGTIVSPQLQTDEDYTHLYNASLLDFDAEKICPVKIDFSKLLLHNRRNFVKYGLSSKKDNISFYFWKNAMLKRSSMEKGGGKFKNFMLRQFFKKAWGNRREFPTVADKSFNQQWRERKGIK